MTGKNSSYLIIFIFLFSLVVFINTALMDFAWDDLQQIVYNPLLDNIKFTFFRLFKENLNPNMPVYFRPVFTYSLALDTILWGKQNPYGYHFTNVLLNALVAVLAFFVMKKCEIPERIAFLSTLIFAAHPAHCEVVANISARNESLSAFFMLSSFLVYFSDWRFTILKRCFAVILFFLALLSKENAVLFPLIIIFYERLFLKKDIKDLAKDIVPFVLVLMIYFVLRRLFLPVLFGFNDAFKERLFTAIVAFIHHIKITFFPIELKVFYDVTPLKSINLLTLLTFILIVAILTAITFIDKKNQVKFFIIWFCVILLPASNLFAIIRPSPIADRYSFLPSLGMIVIFVLLTKNLFFDKEFKLNFFGKAFYTILILFISVYTMQRNWIWKDYPAFARKMVEDAPKSAFAYNNLGISLALAKDYKGAEDAFKKTLEIQPKHNGALYGLGRVYFDLGRYEDAKQYFELVISDNPNFFDALYYLGETYKHLNMLREAEDTFFRLIKINPFYDLAYNALADIYMMQGNYNNAVVFLKKAILHAPWNDEYKAKFESITKQNF